MPDSKAGKGKETITDAAANQILAVFQRFHGFFCRRNSAIAGTVFPQEVIRGYAEFLAHCQHIGRIRYHLVQFPAGDGLSGDAQSAGQRFLTHASLSAKAVQFLSKSHGIPPPLFQFIKAEEI